jgi:hypothetical protein
LHHTFKQPVIKRSDKADQFMIERKGWGAFELRAEVKLVSGAVERLSAWLQLAYPDGQAAMTKAGDAAAGKSTRQQRVFLSYGAEDRVLANQVHTALEQQGYEVMDPQELEVGMPWKQATQKMLRESDMVVGLITSEFASPAVVEELNTAFRSSKKVVAFTDNDVHQTMGLDQNMLRHSVNLKNDGATGDMLSVMEKVKPEHGG